MKLDISDTTLSFPDRHATVASPDPDPCISGGGIADSTSPVQCAVCMITIVASVTRFGCPRAPEEPGFRRVSPDIEAADGSSAERMALSAAACRDFLGGTEVPGPTDLRTRSRGLKE